MVQTDFLSTAATQATPARISRRRDPQSSHDAARKVTETGHRDTSKARVLAVVRAHPGLTSSEISTKIGTPRPGIRNEVARRLPDLREDGVVRSETPPRGELRWFPVEVTK